MEEHVATCQGKLMNYRREYGCKPGHEVVGHDPAVLEIINNKERVPFLLSHRSGMTRELLELIISMVCNGLLFVQIHDILAERLHMLQLKAEKRFLEDVKTYSAHPIVFYFSSPDLGYQTNCPSRNIITDFFPSLLG